MKQLKEFLNFVQEREKIRMARAMGKKAPWTKDAILQQYRFCNIRREDDRVTRWIHFNFRTPNGADVHLWFAMAVARMVNWPESLEDVRESVFSNAQEVHWKPQQFVTSMNNRKAAGLKVFTSAYMIRAIEAAEGETKADYLAEYVFTPLWEDRSYVPNPRTSTLADLHNWLVPHYGMGSFLAAQVIADVKHDAMWKGAKDWQTFAAPGPGSMRGLSRVDTGELGTIYRPEEWLKVVHLLQRQLNERRHIKLDAQNVQNCLCEFDKYMRAKTGEGRPRQNFTPNKEPLP